MRAMRRASCARYALLLLCCYAAALRYAIFLFSCYTLFFFFRHFARLPRCLAPSFIFQCHYASAPLFRLSLSISYFPFSLFFAFRFRAAVFMLFRH